MTSVFLRSLVRVTFFTGSLILLIGVALLTLTLLLIPTMVAGNLDLLAQVDDKVPADGGIVLVDVTKEAGLYEPLAGMMGHGGAWGDFDGDGRIDLYVGGFCDRPDTEYAPAKKPVPNHLFRNLGNGKFAVVAQPAVIFHGRTSGAIFADLDNNGSLELYSANNAAAKTKKTEEPQKTAQTLHSKLFRNDKGVFTDISAASGACPDALFTARNIGVFDYDADGKLDLFVVEDRFRGGGKSRSALFRNLGDLKFEDVTVKAGLPEDIFGLGLAVADINGDRRPDIFVGHCNRLFLSQKDGSYREAVELRELFGYKEMSKEDWACGAAFGDLDNDGLLDLVVSHHHTPARLRVFKNEGLKNGLPQFREITRDAGLAELIPIKIPHVEIQDFDNDGKPDLYTTAAWLDENGKVTPLIFRHTGIRDGVPQFVAPRPLKAPMVYYPAGPSGDYDNDGRLDLFLINWFQGNYSRLLHNESPPRRWLQVQVAGKSFNRMGIGSQVRLYQAGKLGQAKALLGFQEVTIGYGYASGQPALCHFGLDAVAAVDVEVTLPTGKVVTRLNAAADQRLTIEEP